jgi:hypothetical protein
MNSDAGEKIKMLKGSMRCFIFGMLGLLPVIGLPFALGALWVSGGVRAKEKKFWNAARPYRLWGIVCAAFGALAWSIVDTFLVFHIFNATAVPFSF